MKASSYHKRNIARKFNRAVYTYDAHADLQYDVGQELISALFQYSLHPNRVLDLGVGTGQVTKQLMMLYPSCQLIGLDLADKMLELSARRLANTQMVCADFDFLPFQENSFDLIFSNMSLQWSFDLMATIKHTLYCLKPQGKLALTLLVDDTLHELPEQFGLSTINPCYSSKMIISELSESIFSFDLIPYYKEFCCLNDLFLFLRRTGASYSTANTKAKFNILPALQNTSPKKFNTTFTVLRMLLRK